MSHIVLLKDGWKQVAGSSNEIGLLKLIGFEKLYGGNVVSQPRPPCIRNFFPEPLTQVQAVIWEAFLPRIYRQDRFSCFDGIRPPAELLELLMFVIGQDLFDLVQIMTNLDRNENMLVGLENQGQLVPIARWCPPRDKLLSEDDVIALVQEVVTKEATGYRISIDLRLRILDACWKRGADLRSACFSYAPAPRIPA